MALELGDYLKSINTSKVNLMKDDDPETVSSFPLWIVMQLLSYSNDAVLLLNELQLGTFDNKMAYEYLLYALPKKSRFNRLVKPEENADIELLMRYYSFNRQEAKDALDLLSNDQVQRIREAMDEGGVLTERK